MGGAGAAAVVYFALCMRSHVNIGVRHILPVYPFLFVALAAALARRNWGKRTLAALVLVLAVESLAIWPHYWRSSTGSLGGPDKGPEYLVDFQSGLGAGTIQPEEVRGGAPDRETLRLLLRHARMDYYKLDYLYLPRRPDRRASQGGLCRAVSATQLMGAYVGEDTFRWLRERKPMAKVWILHLPVRPAAAVSGRT